MSPNGGLPDRWILLYGQGVDMVSDVVDRMLLRMEEQRDKDKASLADILAKRREAEDDLHEMNIDIARLEGKLELCEEILAAIEED